MKNFRTHYNYQGSTSSFEQLNSKSETIPGQALTVREMLQNYVRGIGLDGLYHEGSYQDDPDFDDYDPTHDPAFDVVDATQMLHELQRKKDQKAKPVIENTDEPVKVLDDLPK